MKKFNKKILIVVFAIIIIVVGIILLFTDNKKTGVRYYKDYIISDEVVDVPGMYIRNTDELSKKHCLDDICVTDFVIHYKGNTGKIDYKITNKSKKKKTGYMKFVFVDKKISFSYNLNAGQTKDGTIQYSKLDLSNLIDYELKNLSKKELSNIKK